MHRTVSLHKWESKAGDLYVVGTLRLVDI